MQIRRVLSRRNAAHHRRGRRKSLLDEDFLGEADGPPHCSGGNGLVAPAVADVIISIHRICGKDRAAFFGCFLGSAVFV